MSSKPSFLPILLVLSANSSIEFWIPAGRSLIYRENKSGPCTDPWVYHWVLQIKYRRVINYYFVLWEQRVINAICFKFDQEPLVGNRILCFLKIKLYYINSIPQTQSFRPVFCCHLQLRYTWLFRKETMLHLRKQVVFHHMANNAILDYSLYIQQMWD